MHTTQKRWLSGKESTYSKKVSKTVIFKQVWTNWRVVNIKTWNTRGNCGQIAFDKFEEIYVKRYNTAYPLKSQRKRRKNERVNPKPCILPWLEDAIARKQNALYHEFVKTPSLDNKAKYNKLSIFCKKHVFIWKVLKLYTEII